MKTVFISGPVSHDVESARTEFEMAERELKLIGHKVINPFTLIQGLDLHPVRDYEKIMRICISEMVTHADEVITLVGWENSPGANREVSIARAMFIPVVFITKYVKQELKHIAH